MFNKDLYYKKYLKYKNKYITLQSQIGGTTISPPLLQRQNGTIGLNPGGPQPPGGGPAPAAPPPENDDVPILPILPYRQNATRGSNTHVVTAPVAPPPENENVPYRENATRGLNPHVVPPSVPHQNETRRVRARIPSVSFGYGQPDLTNVSAAPGYDSERRRRNENEE